MNEIVTSVTLRSDALAKKQEWLETRDSLLNTSSKITEVNSTESLEVSGATQALIGKHIKELAAERLAVTRPIDDVKKKIMASEKELVKSLESEMTRIKKLNDDYATEQYRLAQIRQQEQFKAAAEAQRKIDEQQAELMKENPFGDSAEFAPLDEVLTVPRIETEKPSTLANNRTVIRWGFEIIDSTNVPREFCKPDESLIRTWMNYQVKLGNTPELSGVVFNSKISVEGR
ncbi:MAG: hypothetical protein M0P69_13855 [Bacteroidales bacterium]|jgi:hypothetical protein|nr:hypothetical protein [Bacteroidales bacterium]